MASPSLSPAKSLALPEALAGARPLRPVLTPKMAPETARTLHLAFRKPPVSLPLVTRRGAREINRLSARIMLDRIGPAAAGPIRYKIERPRTPFGNARTSASSRSLFPLLPPVPVIANKQVYRRDRKSGPPAPEDFLLFELASGIASP